MTMTVHPVRAVLLIGASGAAGLALTHEGLAQARSTASLESLVTAGVVLGGAAASLVIAALSLATLAEALFGWRPRAAVALPGPLRRFVVGSVVAAVAAGVAVPAHADEAYPGWVPAVVASPSPTLSPPEPSASPSPVVTEEPPPTPAPVEPEPEGEVVELHDESWVPALPTDDGNASPVSGDVHIVVRGDSLWRIAGELLGPDATVAAIAETWPAIYQANRDTIGSDPGLIVPGQALTIPHEVAR